MRLLLGLDPGGKGAFGWCLLVDRTEIPLKFHAAGIADHARSALDQAQDAARGAPIVAAGIDAPLTWNAAGARAVDDRLRSQLKELKMPNSGGTVNQVNSLRGACLVQGMLAAMLLQREHSGLSLTEAHPKATLWLLGLATRSQRPRRIRLNDLQHLIAGGPSASEHVRDAALGAIAAWACRHKPAGWHDLAASASGSKPEQVVSPLAPLPTFWLPAPPPSR